MFDAASYQAAPFAIEYRNQLDDPPDQWMARLRAAGVRATWIAVVSPFGEPWYPSRILPKLPQVPADHCRRLVEEAHARDITVVSWWPMNHNKTALELHPDWAIRPLLDPEHRGGRVDYPTAIFPCPTSPYRDMLYELVAEAIDLTGIDGYFFDGATFGYNGGPFQMTCCCERCAGRFRAETGLAMPQRLDFADPSFRCFIRWEYDLWKDYVRGLARAIHAAKSGAYIGLNVFNRPPDLDFRSGTPLEEITGCAVTLCAELGWTPNHPYDASGMLCKVFRAMQGGRAGGAELYAGSPVWLELWESLLWSAESVRSHLIANGLSAIAQNCCVSYGTDRPISAYGDLVPHMTQALSGPRQHAGGAPLNHIGVHLSGQTKDYIYQLQHMRYWDHMHAVHELLAEAHLPFDYVLDDQLRPDHLARYAILLMPESISLSLGQVQAVRAYVERGGILVAGGAISTADEWGWPWPDQRMALGDLFGIDLLPAPPDRALAEWVPADIGAASGGDAQHIPLAYADGVIACRAETAAELRVCATLVPGHTPAVVERCFGKGIAAYMNVNLGAAYLAQPDDRLARFFTGWLARLAPPPVTFDGPWCVTMEAYEWAAGETRVHLDNQRSRLHRSWRTAPAAGGSVRLHGQGQTPRAARLLLCGDKLAPKPVAEGWEIVLPQLPRYEVVQILW